MPPQIIAQHANFPRVTSQTKEDLLFVGPVVIQIGLCIKSNMDSWVWSLRPYTACSPTQKGEGLDRIVKPIFRPSVIHKISQPQCTPWFFPYINNWQILFTLFLLPGQERDNLHVIRSNPTRKKNFIPRSVTYRRQTRRDCPIPSRLKRLSPITRWEKQIAGSLKYRCWQ